MKECAVRALSEALSELVAGRATLDVERGDDVALIINPATGARLELTGRAIRLHDAAGVLRFEVEE